MPIVNSKYKTAKFFRNGHIQTLLPYVIRTRPRLKTEKKSLQTRDGDQISYFHFANQSKKLVLITHGLEGRGDDKYILHMAKIFGEAGFDVLTWNMRTCGGEMNKTQKFYNALDYDDLDLLVSKFEDSYEEINLIGISLGGSVTGNYVSRNASNLSAKVKKACLLSTPLHLESSRVNLETRVSKILYQGNFLYSMKSKVKEKVQTFDIPINLEQVKKAKFISEIDHLVIAPLYGYKDGEDYREKASCLPHLSKVKIPVLILNALDDPFLGDESYPYELAKSNELIFLETPKHGGHIGFIKSFKDNIYHHEQSILNWFS